MRSSVGIERWGVTPDMLVFAKGDIESLADVLERLIGDPALRARLGRNGRDWVVRQRTWTEMGRRAAGRLSALRECEAEAEA